MAIYVFSLLVGYYTSGVDNAQGVRNAFLHKSNREIYYIFDKLPEQREIEIYNGFGISSSAMLSMPLFLSNNYNLAGNYSVVDKLKEMKEKFEYSYIAEAGDNLNVYKGNMQIATVYLKKNRNYVAKISYFNNNRLISSEYYGDTLLYTDYYMTVQENGYLHAKKVRTAFLNKNGTVAFDCFYGREGKTRYVYPNGKVYSVSQMQALFIKQLNLSADDTIIIDRPSFFEYVQPLFSEEIEAKIVVFLHSGHYFYPGESDSALFLNHEYYYWFKYVNRISLFLVSTEEQKQDLICRFNEYECKLPRIEVIPIIGLKQLELNEKRRENSILTVSRLAEGKKIEWIIEAVVQAHKKLKNVTLDIYGDGLPRMVAYLTEYVRKNNAEEYIHFMGFCEMGKRYQDYEMYVTASVFETLGLSVMEAVGSGNAIIGLNVRYGNRLFVEDGKNGRLIDFCPSDSNDSEKVNSMIHEMADAIVEIFEDKEKLEAYRKHSYEIAKHYLNEKIESQWLEVLETL